MNGLGILGAILGGIGGIGGGYGAGEKLNLAREELERQKALDAAKNDILRQQLDIDRQKIAGQSMDVGQLFQMLGLQPPNGMSGSLPNDIAVKLVDQTMKQRALEDERTAAALQNARVGSFINQARTGGPAQLEHQLGAGEDPEAAAMIPRVAGPMGADEFAAGLRARGEKASEVAALLKMLRPDADPDKVHMVSENTRGYLQGNRYVPLPGVEQPGPMAPPEARPGFEVRTSWDAKGRPSYAEERISSGVERDSMARERGYGSFVQAPANVQASINKYIDDQSLRRSREQGMAAANKPVTEGDADVIKQTTAALSAVDQVKTFSPDEIQRYVGLINRPVAAGKEVAAGIGLGRSDPRYAQFEAAVGRMSASMFDAAGKALTPMEKQVSSRFVTTGEEPNSTVFMEKTKIYEAYTRAKREATIALGRTPRSQLDVEQYDRFFAEALQRAGIGTQSQQPHPGWGSQPQKPASGGWSIQRVN